jgi:hypothetical protein
MRTSVTQRRMLPAQRADRAERVNAEPALSPARTA